MNVHNRGHPKHKSPILRIQVELEKQKKEMSQTLVTYSILKDISDILN